MTRRKRLWLLWALVLAVAAMIFLFSAQDGETSMQTSGSLTDWVIHLLYPDYDALGWEARQAIYGRCVLLVRKGAHFTEFALLGASLRLLLGALGAPLPLALSWVLGALYACTDEWHQKLVGSRTAAWKDVGIDSAGVLFGAAVLSLLLFLSARRGKKRANP